MRDTSASSNLVELLQYRGDKNKTKTAFTFLDSSEEQNLTYEMLDLRARTLATNLIEKGLGGERVLLAYPPGLDFVIGFFACLYAGATAVPAYPPRSRHEHWQRLHALCKNADCRGMLTTSELSPKLAPWMAKFDLFKNMTLVLGDVCDAKAEASWQMPDIKANTLAFLQYTSGSTGDPKGVMVTHGNLWHNQHMIQDAFQQSSDSVVVGWLPLYHDMGLIGNVLQTIFTGAHGVLMSPMTMLRDPITWLQAIDRFKGTTSGGPNFAYALCTRRIEPEQVANLDLSSWQVAFNGAEPVRAATLEHFAEHFAPAGFKREAFLPCYGLAESTLFVAGTPCERYPALYESVSSETEPVADRPRLLVGCGPIASEGSIPSLLKIVNPETSEPLGDGEVGEIWYSSPSVAAGYWNQEEATLATFCARLATFPDRTFLRTGDLGFMDGEELYITGRLKDLIIIRGRNHYAQDIEETAQSSHDALRQDGTAAFSIYADGEERLVIIQEVERTRLRNLDHNEVIEAIRTAVSESHQVQVYAVMLLKPAAVPKTSSGKIRRRHCRQLYLGNNLTPINQGQATTRISQETAPEEALSPQAVYALPAEERKPHLQTAFRQLAAKVLNCDPVQIPYDKPLTSLGIDSMTAVELQHRLEQDWNLNVSATDFLEELTIEDLTTYLPDQNLHLPPSHNLEHPPLSFSQTREWMLARMGHSGSAFNLDVMLRLQGNLNEVALHNALQHILERHQPLRTTIGIHYDEPIQVIAKPNLHLPLIDLSNQTKDQAMERVKELSQEAFTTPFSLERGPLIRFALYRITSELHMLFVVQHHITSDAWSFGVMLNELAILYNAYSRDEEPSLPELSRTYADYAVDQRTRLQGSHLENLRDFWAKQLEGSNGGSSLPVDHPRKETYSYSPAYLPFSFSASLSRQIKVLAAKHHASRFMLLQAACKTLLYRYTGDGDQSIGSFAANRNQPGASHLIGFFVNTLVYRTSLEDNPTFTELLQRERNIALETFAHQELPFEQILAAAKCPREKGRLPLFQVMVAYQTLPPEEMDLHDLKVKTVQCGFGQAPFDLTIWIWPQGERLEGKLEYNRDLFDQPTITRFLNHYRELLTAVSAQPERRIHEYNYLDRAEQARCLENLQDPAPTRQAILPVHKAIRHYAKRRPGATAVAMGPEDLSYGELSAQTNFLALELRRFGVTQETPVAVCMPRSPQLIVAILAVLEAGGFYVPLEPDSPHERLTTMMADCGATLVLTDSKVTDFFDERVTRLNLDQFGLAEKEGTPLDLDIETEPQQIAYMIYTSGSTGRPKGVLTTTQALANHTDSAAGFYEIGPADRCLQFASIGFDASAEEIYPTLIRGACLQLRTEDMLTDATVFLETCENLGITVLNLPTAFWHELAATSLTYLPPALRVIIIGGEKANAALYTKWHAAFGDRCWTVNTYGPTEATVVATRWLPSPETTIPNELPIGHAIDNVHALVLDPHLNLVPERVPGELCLSGVALARGYLGHPALTARQFVPNPYATEPGQRLYRTGDLVSRNNTSGFDFLGRIDTQVKIRGFRVERGEIESVLSEHPAVTQAVVLPITHNTATHFLAAFYLQDAPCTPNDLRDFLNPRLPNYMIPATFTALPRFPLTASGKVDLKALAEKRDLERPETTRFQEASTPSERILSEIWSTCLGIPRVGIDDNFFDLGGHSLLIIRALPLVRKAFGVEVEMRLFFEAPTIALMASALDNGSPPELPEHPPIPSIPRDGALPLSFAQERMWLLFLLESSGAYNVPMMMALHGPLQAPLLRKALDLIIERHEILRTTFPRQENGMPGQIIHPTLDPDYAEIDREGANLTPDPATWDDALTALVDEAIDSPFDLLTGPLMRVRLIHLDQESHVIVLNLHHIIVDGWSMEVLVREWQTIYGALVENVPNPLAPLSIQYADFAVWQRGWLQEREEQQLNYWRERLAGLPPLFDLPTDFTRPVRQSFRGETVTFSISEEQTQILQELGQEVNASLFMTTLTAFKILLYRYAAQDDVIVGTPVANRENAELEGLIGFFANTLVLHTQMDTSSNFLQMLERVRSNVLSAYANQDLPFERLVEGLQPQRDLSYAPVVQVMFSLLEQQPAPTAMGDLSFSALPIYHTASKFDLSLMLQHADSGLLGHLEYCSDLWTQETILLMLEHFKALISSIVKDGQQNIMGLPIFKEAERKRLLYDWNSSPYEDLPHPTLQDWFQVTAARHSDRIAVIEGPRKITFGELDLLANHMAHALIRRGIGPEDTVGICLNRSIRMIAAMLGVLKTGAAYVPLNPDYPLDRLRITVEDSKTSVILSRQDIVEVLGDMGAPVFCLDREHHELFQLPDTAPGTSAATDNIAYLIYTSGTTGRPKGVLITHRNALRMLMWARKRFCEEDLRFTLAATSITFDISIYEIFLPLVTGGTVVLAENALVVNELPDRDRLTLINTVPSVMDALLRGGDLPRVRVVNLAGEALSRDLADRIYQQPGNHRLYNLYGPSEATTYSSEALVPKEERGEPVIGRPIHGTTFYILDKKGRPAPIGAVGVLHVGGAGLARGYMEMPALTAQKFRPDPFSKQQGKRLYDTGDLARYRPNGDIQYLGRADFQVKIHGFRIEPAEIETHLRRMEGIDQAAVIVASDNSGEKRLAAYVTATFGHTLDTAELLSDLSTHLPVFMVPASMMILESMPLNANGKLDRKALPAPNFRKTKAQNAPPTTVTEKHLVSIWQEVLQQDSVGIHDDFFRIGGHSLMAVQIISRIRDTFGKSLPLRSIFEHSTIAELAHWVERDHDTLTFDEPQLIPVTSDSSHPLSFSQRRLWFIDQLEGANSAYNIVSLLDMKGPLNVLLVRQSLTQIIERHAVLRTRFLNVNGEPIQDVRDDMIPDIEVVEEIEEGTLNDRIFQEAQIPFDLAQGPLLRVRLYTLEPNHHQLLTVMHHSISDGWSMGIMANEMIAIYSALLSGETPRLPELPISYIDYAHQQQAMLDSETWNLQLDYWTKQLSGAPALLELPTDKPRPEVMSLKGAAIPVAMSQDLSRAIATLSNEHGCSVFMTLLSAFAVTLHRYSGQNDILVGTPHANRPHRDLENMIGFFVNTLAMRMTITDQMTFNDLLVQVKEVALNGFSHAGTPFEEILKRLDVTRSLSHSPLFQTMFVYQNMAKSALNQPGLEIKPLETPNTGSLFDFMLIISPGEQGFYGQLQYATDLFEQASMEKFFQRFCLILEKAVESPDSPLGRPSILTEAEKEHLYSLWAGPSTTRKYLPITTRIEQHAAKKPDALAVITDSQQLTYRQLDRRANYLANQLQEHGVTHESLVGIGMPRTATMALAFLAIYKAGACPVSLDPSSSSQRIQQLLNQLDLKLILTVTALKDSFQGETSTLILDQGHEEAGQGPSPSRENTPEQLAYVTTTSGSIGTSKPIGMTHAALANLIDWHQALELDSPPITMQSASINFDISYQEIYTTWCAGGTLIIPNDEDRLNPSRQIDLIERFAISRLFLPVIAFQQFVNYMQQNQLRPKSLLQIITAGEQLRITPPIRDWFATSGCQLYSHYGPSTTHVVTSLLMEDSPETWPNLASMGRPLENCTTSVLNEQLEPCPIGVKGELMVSGPQLARGYISMPALTAQQFIPDPFSSVPGARLYRTGDQASFNSDGTIAFNGRMEQQVKLRGFRVGLGEIESALLEIDIVDSAAVMLYEQPRKVLAGFVTACAEINSEELKSHLSRQLPNYMVPTVLTVLHEMPLDNNGKILRNHLPKPQFSTTKETQAPETPTQIRLAELWCDLLKLESVGIEDNFFDLGGHSLLATQLIASIQEVFKIKLEVKKLFQHVTIASLADYLDTLLWAANGDLADSQDAFEEVI